MSDFILSPDATPILASPTLQVLGNAGGDVVTNATQPVFEGTLIPGDSVLVSVDGDSSTGSFATPLGASSYTWAPVIPLTPGRHQAKAEQINFNATTAQDAVSGYSAPVNLLVLPGPVSGVTTANVSSAQIGALLGQGYTMQFVPGTEALQLVNGTLSVAADTDAAFVQRLYEGLLGRQGDGGGLSLYTGFLGGSGNRTDVATDFLNSPEYQGLHAAAGGVSDLGFVTSLYQGFLGRAPDQAGLDNWTASLAQGASRGQVAAGFAQSDEAKVALAADTARVWTPNVNGALVDRLYETALDRVPDTPGLQGWTQALQNGLTPAQLAADFIASAEFQAGHAGQTNTQLVTNFYQDGLGRTPEAAGLQGWLGQLQYGIGQGDVLLGIVGSLEATAHLSPAL